MSVIRNDINPFRVVEDKGYVSHNAGRIFEVFP